MQPFQGNFQATWALFAFRPFKFKSSLWKYQAFRICIYAFGAACSSDNGGFYNTHTHKLTIPGLI